MCLMRMNLLEIKAGGLMAVKKLPAERHPAAVYLARLAPGSRRTMRAALDTIASTLTSGKADAVSLDWSRVRYQHSQAIRTALTARYAAATANKCLAALRGVLRECWRLGLMDAESYQRASDVEAVKGEALPPGRALTNGELRAIFTACSKDENRVAGARDAALMAVLFGAGLRRSEAVALKLADYNAETGELVIRRGKGNRDRTAYATNGAADALADWLGHRGDAVGPLFMPVDKVGRVADRALTPQAVFNACRSRAEDAGVLAFSPHDMRRSFISHLLDEGADVVTVQKLAGHASLTTTARYDRRGEAAKKKATNLLHVPYRKAS